MKKNNYKYLTLCFAPLIAVPFIATACGVTSVTLTEFKYGNVEVSKDADTGFDKIVFAQALPSNYVICHSSTTIKSHMELDGEGNSKAIATTIAFMTNDQYQGLNDCTSPAEKIGYMVGLSSALPEILELSNEDGSETYPIEPPTDPNTSIDVSSNYFSLGIHDAYAGTDTYTCYLISYTLSLVDESINKFSCDATNNKFIISLQ
ncbi:MAG: hypothetical protein LBD05_01770 [Mycoplasmataceae bacterium]|jgi:hypothetical protein|nr:hypothetical protein [Mycoplasmataceae bacterium]